VKISRRKLFESPSPLQLTTSASELDLSDISNCDKIPVTLHISRSGTTASVDGELTAKSHLQCDRCLESFDRKIRGELKIVVTENPGMATGTADSDIIVFPTGTDKLDISSLLRDAIVLERPMKEVCDEKCKGLCAECGVNLNQSDCGCQDEGFDERWAPLKEIKLAQLEN
tara:strand:- start:1106 stop:1618 length:513 start_codon:yes stop_codon:yes gene_type:complete